MKTYTMLGVDSQNKCCILECLLPFDKLDPNEIEEQDFKYSATDWNGCDDLDRTLELKHLILTGNTIKLKKPIRVRGTDCDMGHTYSWKFDFTEIYETKKLPGEYHEDPVTTAVSLLPVCEKCGYVFRDTLKWSPPGINFEPAICPNCKRFITTVRTPNINYDASTKGFADLCDY